MKTLITLIACLCFGSAMAQKFPVTGIACAVYHADGICSWNKPMTLDSLKFNQSATYAPNSISSLKLLEPSYHFNSNTKTIMKISDLKPDSTFHVWIDKKAITWTSDSTFILKRKP